MPCSASNRTAICNKMVQKEWPKCKHLIETQCQTNVNETPCPKKCQQVLPGCEHICQGTCGQCFNGRVHIACQEDCRRILICGHECESKCSITCPPCDR